MMKGLSLVELAQKIEDNKKGKKDFIADTRDLTLLTRPGVEKPTVVLEVKDQGAFPLQPLVHDQIGARLQIPSKYYDRMLADAPDLLATNVNAWFRKQPESRMLRTLRSNGRAFLSNRYNRIENEEISEVALPVLADIPDVTFVSTEVTDKRLYIQAIAPRIQGEIKRNDVVQAGVLITNSEVGAGAVSVASVLWRLVCLNGMISSDKFRAYHVGRRIEDNSELWASDTVKADDRAILLKVRDMVKAAVDEANFQQRIAKARDLTEGRITGDPQKVVEVLAAKVGVNENEKGGILRALIEGGDLSAWGLLNAVTAQSHNARDYDRAVEFEAAGGVLLDLPKTEWKELLAAA
jgi:hypothetical protein